MSKRKPPKGSKHSPGAKKSKPQRSTQPVVRSPKDSPMRLVAAGPTESPPKPHPHSDATQEAHFDNSKQEAPLVEIPATVLQADVQQMMTDNDAKKAFDFSSATANVRAYQAKLQEMAQADMQFSFEFAQRLATIRSPVEFPRLIAEFTSKRIAMFMEHSKEMAALSTGRRTA